MRLSKRYEDQGNFLEGEQSVTAGNESLRPSGERSLPPPTWEGASQATTGSLRSLSEACGSTRIPCLSVAGHRSPGGPPLCAIREFLHPGTVSHALAFQGPVSSRIRTRHLSCGCSVTEMPLNFCVKESVRIVLGAWRGGGSCTEAGCTERWGC